MARKTRNRLLQTGLSRSHGVVLAGLGALSLGRKKVDRLCETGLHRSAGLGDEAMVAIAHAAGVINDGFVGLRRETRSATAPARVALAQLATAASTQLRARLAPALRRLGVMPAGTKRGASRKTGSAAGRSAKTRRAG